MPNWDRKPGFDLTGKTAVVVGTGNPAGAAIALALAEAGADVAVASATLDGDEVMAAKRAAKAIEALGRRSLSHGWDVTLPTNVQVSYRQVVKDLGTPSILVYNADFPMARPIEKTTDTEFARVQSINQNGAFYAARTFAKELPEGTAGRIIFVTSIIGDRGINHSAAYASSKAGVVGLMKALSQELGGKGTTANCISSGWMDYTEGRGPDEIGQNRLLRFISMRKFGTGADMGPLAVLLASDAAGFLNGQVFHVDGGVMTHL